MQFSFVGSVSIRPSTDNIKVYPGIPNDLEQTSSFVAQFMLVHSLVKIASVSDIVLSMLIWLFKMYKVNQFKLPPYDVVAIFQAHQPVFGSVFRS